MSLEGREECLIDLTWECSVIVAKLYELVCIRSMDKEWITLLHQLILITADSISLSQDMQRSVKVLHLISQISKNLGSWLFGKSPATVLTSNELLSLNVDFTILLMAACNVNEITRKEAARLECYQMVNQMLVFLIKDSLAKKEIRMKLPEVRDCLQVTSPLQYHMIENGLAKLTPSLFIPTSSSRLNQWNVFDQINLIQLEGAENTFIDVISRFIISSVVGSTVNTYGHIDILIL